MVEKLDAELAARQAKAEARLAAAEEKRAARVKDPALAALERLEQEAEEAEAIADAEASYGPVDQDVKLVRSPRGLVIVRRPEYVAVKRFHDAAQSTVEAKDKLGRPCVVWPSKDRYAAMAANDVALVSKVADAAAWLAGFGRTKLEEKSES